MTKTTLLLAAMGLCLGTGGLSPALAQRAPPPPEPYQEAVPPPEPAESTNNKALDRRLDRDEKALRELRGIVLKAQAQGSPVEVKPAGADPAVTDLQTRFEDVESTVRRLTGQAEALRHDLDQTRQQLTEALGQIRALNERADKLQQQITPPPPPVAEGQPVAGGAGVPPQGAAPGDEAQVYQQARQVLDGGDFAGGAAAMQAFIQAYPNSARVGTANYWMGRALAARNQHADAAAAFARSLKGWPQASWAGDSVVQLAGSLVALRREGDACKALGEFDARYAAKASPTTKTLATRTRANANCG